MHLTLTKQPKGVTLIEGFPGFGLVSTIVTSFLLDHLKCEEIGTAYFEEAQPMMAVHGCKMMSPVGIYYNQKYNLVIVHAVTAPKNIEWKASDLMLELADKMKSKEIISIEGVGSEGGQGRAFYFTKDHKKAQKLEDLGITCLGEGIVIGVTAALLQKNDDMVSIFAETESNMPDSKAAAKIVEVLDKYLGLEVDYAPLLKQAEEFEGKLKTLIEKAGKAHAEKDKRELSYLG